MEIFRVNKKNTKLYKKINYLKLLLVIIIIFVLFFILFYFIGREQNINRAIYTSIIISFIVGLGSIFSDLIDYRDRVYVIDDKEFGYIEIHKETVGGVFLRECEYNDVLDQHGIEEIYKHNNKYEGIDKGIIKKVISVKKKYNRTILIANVVEKEWKSSSFFTISKLHIVEKEKKKKMIIPNDYDNYDKLYKKINKIK